jgi:hypothetical protein
VCVEMLGLEFKTSVKGEKGRHRETEVTPYHPKRSVVSLARLGQQ